MFIYVYYFVNVDYRPQTEMKIVPSEGATGASQPMDDSNGAQADDPGLEDAMIDNSSPAILWICQPRWMKMKFQRIANGKVLRPGP